MIQMMLKEGLARDSSMKIEIRGLATLIDTSEIDRLRKFPEQTDRISAMERTIGK